MNVKRLEVLEYDINMVSCRWESNRLHF